MELPFHLKTLPPEALDVIRFFGTLDVPVADVDTIYTGVGLSERSFGKVIRRLVTKGYVQMDGAQTYRLTEQGQRAVEDLETYDESAPEEEASSSNAATTQVKRRLVVALPRTLVAGKTAKVLVGFNPASGGQSLPEPTDMVLRLSVLNGEPSRPKETSLQLDDESAQQSFDITPGNYTKARIKVQVFQLGPNPDDISVAGGLYVDANVVADAKGADDRLTAYGADVTVSG
jgi:predicted transcriptional regulator